MSQRIYLDHAATTPLMPEAREALTAALDRWANPSSPHAEGRAARAALEDARLRIKAALGWNGELIFTSGASEAAALAMRGFETRLVSAVEHESVRRAAGEFGEIAVDSHGIADLQDASLAQGSLVAVQHCNPETGVLQPLDDIIQTAHEAGAVLLSDCAQSAGKLPLPPADLIIISAHKLGGPPGIGALLVRDFGLLQPTGGQERGYRGGTENLPAILGFAAALEALAADGNFVDRQSDNRRALEDALEALGAVTVCKESPRSPFIGSYFMPGKSALAQLVQFDAAGISVSAGSACASGSTKPSHVLAALGLAPEFAANVIRVSFGQHTSRDDVMTFISAWTELARQTRSRAA